MRVAVRAVAAEALLAIAALVVKERHQMRLLAFLAAAVAVGVAAPVSPTAAAVPSNFQAAAAAEAWVSLVQAQTGRAALPAVLLRAQAAAAAQGEPQEVLRELAEVAVPAAFTAAAVAERIPGSVA